MPPLIPTKFYTGLMIFQASSKQKKDLKNLRENNHRGMTRVKGEGYGKNSVFAMTMS